MSLTGNQAKLPRRRWKGESVETKPNQENIMTKCVSCRKPCTPFKTFPDNDPTRRQSGSQFYKGKRTTKYWCEPCWIQAETMNKRSRQKQDDETRQLLREHRARRTG